ncbi:MAG TPA: lamin tail domain-containing protein, partial [Flavobacteriales bacterium]|nr:lamin tail domain-containing protein [Flavobacteriales bacterium]
MMVAVLLHAGMLAAQVRINELKCTRTPRSDGQGPAGDWVELYNAGSQAVDLGGYILTMEGRAERLAQGLWIAPGGTKVLWCGSPADSTGRIALKLP